MTTALRCAVQRALSAWDTTTLKTNGDGMLSEAIESLRAEFDTQNATTPPGGSQAAEPGGSQARVVAPFQAPEGERDLRTAFETWATNTPPDERTNWEVFQAGARAAFAAQPATVNPDLTVAAPAEAHGEKLTTESVRALVIKHGGHWPTGVTYADGLHIARAVLQSQVQPKWTPDHIPAGKEIEAAIDDKLGLVLLPPIRVDRATHAALMESSKATGKIIQAVVRDRLAPCAMPSPAPGPVMPGRDWLEGMVDAWRASADESTPLVADAFRTCAADLERALRLNPREALPCAAVGAEQLIPMGFRVEHCAPWGALTDEANARTKWLVERTEPPFEGADRLRRWQGPTLADAMRAARESLGMTESDVPVQGIQP